jgi:hypothetical protein
MPILFLVCFKLLRDMIIYKVYQGFIMLAGLVKNQQPTYKEVHSQLHPIIQASRYFNRNWFSGY